MNKFAIACGYERTGDLQRNFQRGRAVDRPLVANPIFNGFALDEFHRVEVLAPLTAEMENRCDVAMAELCSRARLG